MNNDERNPPKRGVVLSGSERKIRRIADTGKRITIGTINIFAPPIAHAYTGRYRGRTHHLVFDTFLAGLVFLLLGLVIYFRFEARRVQQEDIVFQPEIESPFVSGEEVKIGVRLHHRSRGLLKNIEVRLGESDHFLVRESEKRTVIAELLSSEERTVMLIVTPLGQVGEDLSLPFFLTYDDAEGHRHSRVARMTAPIQESRYSLELEAPDAMVKNQSADFKFQIKKNGQQPVGVLRIDLPPSFSVIASEPSFDEGKWKIDEDTSLKTFRLRGFFGPAAKETENIVAEYHAESSSLKEILLVRKEHSVRVVSPHLSFSLSSGPGIIQRGKKGIAAALLRNEGADEIREGSLQCELEQGKTLGVHWDFPGIVAQDSTLTLTGKEKSNLSSLPAHGETRIDLPLIVESQGGYGTARINCSFFGQETVEGQDVVFSAYSGSSSLRIVPATAFRTYGRYTEFGAGPIPPKVGFPTVYRIFFEIEDSSRSIERLIVRAFLPARVSWGGNVSTTAGSPPIFEQEKREVTWTLPLFSRDQEKIQASFDVRVLPRSNDVGSLLDLLSESRLTFFYPDSETEESFIASKMTSDLLDDPQTTGKGRVVE